MTHPVPPAEKPDATRIFDEHRDLLIAVAYRVLGRVTDAEDVVQEAWFRWVKANPSEVVNPHRWPGSCTLSGSSRLPTCASTSRR